MVSLVIISTIDLDDWMPGSRAPGLFVFAPLNSREKERGQGVGTFFRLDNATLQNFRFTQKSADRGSLCCTLQPHLLPPVKEALSQHVLAECEEAI